jgi:hypothetical protein
MAFALTFFRRGIAAGKATAVCAGRGSATRVAHWALRRAAALIGQQKAMRLVAAVARWLTRATCRRRDSFVRGCHGSASALGRRKRGRHSAPAPALQARAEVSPRDSGGTSQTASRQGLFEISRAARRCRGATMSSAGCRREGSARPPGIGMRRDHRLDEPPADQTAGGGSPSFSGTQPHTQATTQAVCMVCVASLGGAGNRNDSPTRGGSPLARCLSARCWQSRHVVLDSARTRSVGRNRESPPARADAWCWMPAPTCW